MRRLTDRGRAILVFHLLHAIPAFPMVFWAFRDRSLLLRTAVFSYVSFLGPVLTFVLIAAFKELRDRRRSRRLSVVRDVMDS